MYIHTGYLAANQNLVIVQLVQEANMVAKKKHVVKGRRELIDTGRDKRYVKRNPDGTFSQPAQWSNDPLRQNESKGQATR